MEKVLKEEVESAKKKKKKNTSTANTGKVGERRGMGDTQPHCEVVAVTK